MKNSEMPSLQVLKLVEIFALVLLSKTRLYWSAQRLINQKGKINDLVRNFLNISLEYNFFENKMFSSSCFPENDSNFDVDKTKPMITEQVVLISKIFGDALCYNFRLETQADELIKNKAELYSLVDDIFEMSPAFNLFEYLMYIKRAPLINFKEACTWDHDIFILCTADEVCEPWGFKSGEKVSFKGDHHTVIGVAPYWRDKKLPLVLWAARDCNQFRDSSMPVVGIWKDHDLKKLGFVSIS